MRAVLIGVDTRCGVDTDRLRAKTARDSDDAVMTVPDSTVAALERLAHGIGTVTASRIGEIQVTRRIPFVCKLKGLNIVSMKL